jgi:MFS family permease
MKKTGFHYGWMIVLAGCLTIFACIGLARFSYGLLLPSMGKELLLEYDRMGYISTGNFCGYLIGVAIAPLILRRAGARHTIAGGLTLIALTMFGMSVSTSFTAVLGLYSLTGIGSGIANIPVMVVVSRWFHRSLRGRATGFMLMGNSMAIIFAGYLVPWLNVLKGTGGWRWSWGTLGGVIFLVAVTAGLIIRDDPSQKGLSPAGEPKPLAGAAVAQSQEKRSLLRPLLHLSALYFTFGLTHVVYVTFLVTSLVSERGMAEASAGRFWSVVGIFGFFSGPLFGTFSDRFGRKWGLATVFAVQSISFYLAAKTTGDIPLFLSVALFGLSAWSIPAIISSAVADTFPVNKAASAFSFVTFCLAMGQIIGPAVAGSMANASKTFSTVFLLASIGAAFAVALAAFLKENRVHS